MAFNRPSLSDLVNRIQQDFVSRLSLMGAPLRRAVVYVLSRVMAGAAHGLHGHLEYLSKQLFPDSADWENLRKFGTLRGVVPNVATFASGNVTLTGTNGSPILNGTRLIRSDGAEYETSADATIDSGTATISVTALTAGQDGNCDAGVVLTFESPVSGVDSTATVSTGISGGADEESPADYLVRVIERLQNPPQGGAPSDYEEWAKEVAGVTRVWVVPKGLGPGTVLVRFVRDGDTDLIPDSTEVASVQSHINSLAPATANVTVAAPIADPLNPVLSISPDTADIRAAVEAGIADLIAREAAPNDSAGGGANGIIHLSAIRTAIGNATGLTDYTLTSPAADVTPAAGHMVTKGTVTWA